MPANTEAPFGSWKSPISAEDAYQKFKWIHASCCDGSDLYWSEQRSDGRTVVVRREAGQAPVDVTPENFNVRTRVHEYGGGAYLAADGVVYFSNFEDQRLYRQVPGQAPSPLPSAAGMRYADAVLDRARHRLILVREDHVAGQPQPVNSIAWVPLDGTEGGGRLVQGNDFYSTPRLSPDGSRLAWLTWNHPKMPWDGTELWVGEVAADGSLSTLRRVAGGPEESVFQPEWSPGGRLYFVSDPSGWWNLHRWDEAEGRAKALLPMDAEFGQPQWALGQATFAFLSTEKLICSFTRSGESHVLALDTRTLRSNEIELPYSSISEVRAGNGRVLLVGGSATLPHELCSLDPETGRRDVVCRSGDVTVDRAWFSVGQSIEFPTNDETTAHGFYYAPRNPDFTAPKGERPPLIVMSHGGPTSAANSILRFSIQFWTTRGFAVLDVNYGGSTGYGRAYRERLKGTWGIVDVVDCVNGARHLVARGLADGKRLAIRGGSAGGYTTLCALTFHDTFTVGASYYGVSDLEALAKDTHKFESRYLDGLIGPYPERRDLYLSRSPIHHVERLARPMIILQGLDDPVVPPNQAQMMYDAVRARGLPVAYLRFPGEQHGFVKAENNKRALEAELYFYSRVFGFSLADPVEPVEIANMPG